MKKTTTKYLYTFMIKLYELQHIYFLFISDARSVVIRTESH